MHSHPTPDSNTYIFTIKVSTNQFKLFLNLDITIHQMAAQGELNMLKQEAEQGTRWTMRSVSFILYIM